jgi:glycosidase
MRNFIIVFIFPLLSFSQITTDPSTIEVDQAITITVDINSDESNCNGMNSPNKVYLHSGVGDDSDPWGYNVVGNWGMDDGVGEMSDNGDGTWSITFIPEEYYNLTPSQASTVTKMGLVFRSEDGSQELKDNGCSDFFLNIGAFQVTMINPTDGDVVTVDMGGQTQILAQNTNGPANYELFINGNSYHVVNGTTFYQSSFIDNITENKQCSLVITQGSSSVTKNFTIYVNATIEQIIPENLQEGINYNIDDPTKAILVLNAPLKDFVYIAGSFNEWNPGSEYAMKKNPNSDIFWLEINTLTPGQIETYQYWIYDQNPISGSPEEVKTADPYSTLVLSPFDDPYINEESYPNIPNYPQGQQREVTVLQTAQDDYNWQVTEFTKPLKEDLVIYELLIRDFDSDRNFQDVIDKIEYFKDLNINAIELMPVMEFEGNESWGYNPSFHMALDKFYGTENKFKELVDICHQNGIAVILDIALNHAFGRNPMVRMWMEDPDNNGWGEPSVDNPYFNYEATHSYGVGSDFNHSSDLTKDYTKRVIKHWVEEFKIDGFRWDLTKGFTQECSSGDDSCTNGYRADRVAILKEYADYSWSLDPDHYVIFEHLGGQQEQKEWADYRIAEGKGILLWGKMTNPYNQLTMGYSSDSNISGMGHNSQNFIGKRLIGYAESHDEERLMYNNIQYGASNGNYNITDLNTALERMSALGAVTLTIPGPKMIWHFGELGMENSLFTCNDGSINTNNDSTSGDCKLDTKPQPQWVNNWLDNPIRNEIYNSWARLNELKINEDVFEGNYDINSGSLTPKIYIWDDTLPSNALKNVVVLANFDLTTQNVIPNFPYTGIWYDLMDESGNSSLSVTDTSQAISLSPGEFKVFGNQIASTLSIGDNLTEDKIKIYPNPANEYFRLNYPVNKIIIYNSLGSIIKIFDGEYDENFRFDTSNLESGVYLVSVINDNLTRKIKLIKY